MTGHQCPRFEIRLYDCRNVFFQPPSVLKGYGGKITDILMVASTMVEALVRISSSASRPLAFSQELEAQERNSLDFSRHEDESYPYIFTLREVYSALSLSVAILLLDQITSRMLCYDTWRRRRPFFLQIYITESGWKASFCLGGGLLLPFLPQNQTKTRV